MHFKDIQENWIDVKSRLRQKFIDDFVLKKNNYQRKLKPINNEHTKS